MRSAGILSAMMGLTALVKLLGLLRSARIASLLGTTVGADAFAMAKQLPTLLYDLLLAALPSCLIPIYCQKASPKRGLTCVSLVAVALLGLLSALALMGLGDVVLSLLFPQASAEALRESRQLLPVFALSLPLMGCCGMAMAVCQCEKRYLRPALGGGIASAITLLALYRTPTLSPTYGAMILTASWLLQLLFLLPLPQRGVTGGLAEGLSAFGDVLRLLPASLLSSWLFPFTVACSMTVASRGQGGAARLDYALTFFSAALGVIVSGVINYSYPRLAALSATEERRRAIGRALALLFLTVLPLSLFLCLLSPQIVAFFYEDGHFDGYDTEAVSRLLSALALSLPLCASEELLRRAGLLSKKGYAAYLPPLTGSAAALLLTALDLGTSDAVLPFLGAHAAAVLSGFWLLHREIGATPLRILPPILMGCAALCTVYLTAERLLPSSLKGPIPFSLTVVLTGALAYLTVCRLAVGKERSPSFS